MSSPLIPDVLDLIIDNLSREQKTLQSCCLVSKSWVPHVRRLLFYSIEFTSFSFVERPIGLWTKAFPDPSNSPAHHTRVLLLSDLETVAAVGTHARAWINSFSHILELELATVMDESPVQFSLVPLYGLSPTLKSLSLKGIPAPTQELLDLICSFPLLENLLLHRSTGDDTAAEWEAPSNSPTLAGSLELRGETSSVARKLLQLPNGLHPVKVALACDVEFASLMSDLLSKCSGTLKVLSIYYQSESSDTVPPPFDLSNFTRLEEVWVSKPDVRWITATLRTAKSTNLRLVDISSWPDLEVHGIEPTITRAWQDLDHLLIQLWTSCSIRPRISLQGKLGEGFPREIAAIMLPQLTKGRFVSFPWF